MTARPHLRRYITTFLYPAVLGAGIAWWVQALGTLVERSTPEPHPWSLWFGLWFLVYHGTWYHHELVSSAESPGEKPKEGETGVAQPRMEYGVRHGLADIIDVVALLVAFLGLGFATGSYGFDRVWLTWIAAASIPIAALLNNFERLTKKPATFTSLFLALAVPVAAFVRPAWSRPPHAMSTFLLVAFWIILAVYILWPEAFSSGRVRRKPSETRLTREPAPVVAEVAPAVEAPKPDGGPVRAESPDLEGAEGSDRTAPPAAR